MGFTGCCLKWLLWPQIMIFLVALVLGLYLVLSFNIYLDPSVFFFWKLKIDYFLKFFFIVCIWVFLFKLSLEMWRILLIISILFFLLRVLLAQDFCLFLNLVTSRRIEGINTNYFIFSVFFRICLFSFTLVMDGIGFSCFWGVNWWFGLVFFCLILWWPGLLVLSNSFLYVTYKKLIERENKLRNNKLLTMLLFGPGI